jgi:hypothetical protein
LHSLAVQIPDESAESVGRMKGRNGFCAGVHLGVNSSSVQNRNLGVQEGEVILIAFTGHCTSHAIHWMQSFSLTGSDFFSDVGWPGLSVISNTFTGHTLTQISSASHMSWSTATIVPWIPSLAGGGCFRPIPYDRCDLRQLSASLGIQDLLA